MYSRPAGDGGPDLDLVANGMSSAEIIEAYPYLEAEDIQQALRYAAWLADGVDIKDLNSKIYLRRK